MEKDKRNNRKGETTNHGRYGKETRQETTPDPESNPESNKSTRLSDYHNILSGPPTPKNKKRRFQKRNSIVNLSNYKLTKTETSLLEKGLNFIPTPNREHEARIVQDFLLFERKLRLHHKLHKRRTQKKILQKMTQ